MTATNAYGDQVDPTGLVIVELRSNTAIATALGADVAKRVAGDVGDDVLAPYLLVRRIGPASRIGRIGVTRFRLAISAYGRNRAEAARLIGLVGDVLATKGPRRGSGSVAIYLSTEDVGPQSGEDPDTAEPYETAIYNVHSPHSV